jgi:hypothetical protein
MMTPEPLEHQVRAAPTQATGGVVRLRLLRHAG